MVFDVKTKAKRSNPNQEFITVRGLLVPAGWDEQGNVVSVAVSTFDEDEYLLESDAKEELVRLIRKRVVITGVPRSLSGKKCLSVKSYDLTHRV
jgi:hypothetical protein